MLKICTICKESKELSMFHKHNTYLSGVNNRCKKCVCEIKRSKYIPKERKKKKLPHELYSNSKEYRKEASLRFRRNNFANQIFLATRSRAKRHGIDFDLDISDIIIPKYCPYLKIKLTNTVGKGRKDTNPSIDRIDNSKGYIKGNIEIISDLANKMKLNSSIKQLITFSENALKMHKNRQ